MVAALAAALLVSAAAVALRTSRAERDFPAGGSFVEVDGVRLHFRRVGRGPSLVLIHGNPGSAEDWSALIPTLSARYDVIAIDRPGHGYSTRPADQTGACEQARILHHALGRLAVRRPVMVGHSWGGAVALAYAEAYPRELSGLVVVGTRAMPRGGTGGALYGALRIPIVGSFLERTVMPLVGGAILRGRLAAAYAPERVDARHAARAEALWLRPGQLAATVWDTYLLHEEMGDIARGYGALRVPMRVLVGDHDELRGESEALAARVPGALLRRFTGGGHELPRTRPAVLAAQIDSMYGPARTDPQRSAR